LVAVFSIIAGLLYGAWVDGVGFGWLALSMAAFIVVLAGALAWLHGRQHNAIQPS
jgi:hypothetical protein